MFETQVELQVTGEFSLQSFEHFDIIFIVNKSIIDCGKLLSLSLF